MESLCFMTEVRGFVNECFFYSEKIGDVRYLCYF